MAPSKKRLTLPAALVDELDSRAGPDLPARDKRGHKSQISTRKEQRKAERASRKGFKVQDIAKSQSFKQRPSVKSAVQQQRSNESSEILRDEDEVSDSHDELDMDLDGDSGNHMDDEDYVDEIPSSSKSVRRKLDEEDAEIAALEKKLGLKKGKKSRAFDEDGLGELLEGLDHHEAAVSPKKRKSEEDDDWLAQKRRKADAAASSAAYDNGDEDGEISSSNEQDLRADGLLDLGDSDFGEHAEMDDDQIENEEAGDGDGDGDEEGDGFEGFSDEGETEGSAVRQRENPYVAPTTNVAKYIPPSLRKKSDSSGETDAQLRRRMQGLINRLTNENMISIIKEVSGLYDNYPRQSVTSGLVDLVINLVCSPEKRPDGFFTMMAGFVAGAHKALGVHVSANLIQQLVQVFRQHHDQASGDKSDAGSKHLMALLAELYNMQVVGSSLIFDYVRLLLDQFSELNTELLLRIIQSCGLNLRRDDPHSLKDIVNHINIGSLKNMSVRTSFMIEEMKKLQKDKSKATSRNKDLAEQRTQIRKRIGTLGGGREVQPLHVGLKEIEKADKNGKWWVVGASWSGKREENNTEVAAVEKEQADDSAHDLEDDDDLGIPDLWQLAKEQGFNTEIRQRIFVALHAATDYENAELLIRKLRLNKHQKKEIPEVIVRSGERQAEYNRYYWLVASRFCGDRELTFQFKRSLTMRFRRMGEDIDTGDDFDAEDGDDYDTRWVHNIGRFYGSLVANGSFGLDILKYRNLAALQEKAQWFVEVLFITLLQRASPEGLPSVFGKLEPDMARAVQYFLKKYIRKTELLKNKDEKRTLKKQCNAAIEILEKSLSAALTDSVE